MNIQVGDPNNLKLNNKPFISKNYTCPNCQITCNQYFKHVSGSCCYFCYVLCNVAFFSDIILCKSVSSQKEIITKTYNYLKDNNYMPQPDDIGVSIVNISTTEFCRLISYGKTFDIKIVFPETFNFGNLKLDLPLFDDIIIKPNKVEIYKFTKDEAKELLAILQ